MVASVSRHQEINFFGPQEVSHRSLWTSSELNDTQSLCGYPVRLQKPLKLGFSAATFGDFGAITQTFVAGYAGQTLRGSAERSASKSASSTPPACSKWLQLQKPFSASLLHPYRRSSSSTCPAPATIYKHAAARLDNRDAIDERSATVEIYGCTGRDCLEDGSRETLRRFKALKDEHGLDIKLRARPCMGPCGRGRT